MTIETDALVVGAGPVGLFQVFELGLLEMRAEVVDTLPRAGGQCVELYGDKPIYDIPALAVCSGSELAERLLKQIEPFAPGFHFNQEVARVQRREDGRFDVATSSGTAIIARTIVIAAGVGSFQPRTLKVEGIERYAGTQLFHGDAEPAAGRRVVVVGGDAQALDVARRHADAGAQVTLLHRREIDAAPVAMVAGQITGHAADGDRLTAIDVLGTDGSTRRIALDTLIVCLGLSPRLGPIAGWGLALQRKQLVVDTERFQTSEPGIYAVGDVVTYPGKKKLIVCGFHEATLAAFAAAAFAHPDRQVPLQYTTTSPRLHRLLGVDTPL